MKRAQGRPTVTWSPLALKRAPLGTGVALIAALLVVVFSAAAQAAPGDLDPTFSGDGKQTTDFGFGSGDAAATVRQPDGKIVAVGNTPGTGFDFALARYNPNGNLDTSFSGDGKQTTDFGSAEQANGVALQADGRIVVVGSGADALRPRPLQPQRLARHDVLRRRQADDRLRRVRPAKAVAIQGDGKIVVVGTGGPGGLPSPATTPTARWIRPSPATASKRRTSGPNAVALQADGKIVVVGAKWQ